jgi:hypothetical protein
MKRIWPIVLFVLASFPLVAADSPWQYGRIVDVSKSVTTKTRAWVVNTPITEDQVAYTVSVHLQDKIIVGTYELTPEEAAPPEEWMASYPVKVQVAGDRLYLRAPTGELRLRIVRRKNAKMMAALTEDEKKHLEQVETPAGPLTGFAEEPKAAGGATAKPAEEAPQTEPATPNVGAVMVRSTPYLSEVFVDGDSMGYTPAKINLPPGKHTFRVEKAGYKVWTKEIVVTVGSELTLDASLARK